MKTKPISFLFAAAMALSGCGRPAPTGQVVAVVNDEEVTLDELRTEAAARGLGNAEDAATRRRVLQTVIRRKLLVQEARRDKLDQQSEFVLNRRRAEELLLTDLLTRALTDSAEVPTDTQVSGFLHDHPSAFAGHVVFWIDQIDVRTGERSAITERLARARSLDEAAAMLTQTGIVGQRSTTEWDSTFMPASLVARLERLPRDAPFVYESPATIVIGVVRGRRQIARNYADRVLLARQNIRQQRIGALVEGRLRAGLQAATIAFQPDYVSAIAGR